MPDSKKNNIDWLARLAAKKSEKFEELYPAQESALNLYSSAFLDEPSVAVELPTGSGKTLIALMVLDYWLEQKKRAAVLCGTKNLARQLKEEADSLGIPAILFEGPKSGWSNADRFKYGQCKAVAILNYWGYINQSPGIDPADVLVLDDAHLAESAAHGLFSLDISRVDHEDLYAEVVANLADRFPHYTVINDYKEGKQSPISPTELINFTDWLDYLPQFEDLMDNSNHTSEGNTLFFTWRRLRTAMPSSLCFVGPNSVSVRPGSYPLFAEKHMSSPKQRIFLSATIGSADDLARRIGIPKVKTLPIEPKFRLSVPGKRLLLFPDSENHEGQLEALAFDVAVKLKRSVWLCGSSHEAKVWCDKLSTHLTSKEVKGQPVFLAKASAEEIDQFVDAPTGHLFCAARYDGMDFEGDICRLVVMPSLPYACGPFERFVSENLADASFLSARVLQRMKQALGRATRNDHDWAVYIFLKNSVSQYLTSADSFMQFPSNVQEEISFGVEVSSKTWDDVIKVCNGFLRGKLGEIGFPQAKPTFPNASPSETSSAADVELQFWHKLSVTRSFDHAAVDAEAVAKALEAQEQSGYSLFWRYLKGQACYLRFRIDSDQAGLANTQGEICKILNEPRQSAWFSRLNRLRQTIHLEVVPDDADADEFDIIAAGWNHLLNGDLRNSKKHDEWLACLQQGLAGSDHNTFSQAVRNLLRLIGWEAEVRDHHPGETDVLASTAVGGNHYLLVVEGKPEAAASKPIPLRDVNQASGQLTRYKSMPDYQKYAAASLLVSKANSLDSTAAAAASNITIIRQTALELAGKMSEAAFRRYAAIRFRKGLLPKRSECIEPLRMSPRLLGLFNICSEKGRVLDDTTVLAALKRS
jgi:hypothetical protein